MLYTSPTSTSSTSTAADAKFPQAVTSSVPADAVSPPVSPASLPDPRGAIEAALADAIRASMASSFEATLHPSDKILSSGTIAGTLSAAIQAQLTHLVPSVI
jgi:hypothetical protein